MNLQLTASPWEILSDAPYGQLMREQDATHSRLRKDNNADTLTPTFSTKIASSWKRTEKKTFIEMLNSSANFPLTNQDDCPRVAYIMVLFNQKD